LSIQINQLRILHRAQHHLAWQCADAVHAHTQSVFGIDGKKNGCFSDLLEMIDERRLGFRAALKKTDAADIEAVDVAFNLLIKKNDFSVRAQGRKPDGHQLGQLLAVRQRMEHTVNPLRGREITVVLGVEGKGKEEKKNKTKIFHRWNF
jgi:hypothetical protein